MRQKNKRLRPYFEVGHKIQLQPDTRLHAFPSVSNYLKGLHATIMRIERRPDPNFLEIETQEGWQEFRRLRSVFFWVKLDDFPELHDYYKQNEVLVRYRELRPLSPKMSKQHLAHYCQERFVKEQNKHRQDAYFQMMLYFNGQRPSWPLSDLIRYRGNSKILAKIGNRVVSKLLKPIQQGELRAKTNGDFGIKCSFCLFYSSQNFFCGAIF
jgi:hypothetical protein